MVSAAAMASRVDALETVVMEQRADTVVMASRIDELQQQISQLLARLDQPDTSAGESTAALGSQPGTPGEPEVYPLTVEHSHPRLRVARYYVLTVAVRQDAIEGIYTVYSDYVWAVKDHSQTDWEGRGNIPYAQGVVSQSFLSRNEAEAHYRSQTGLAADQPIPYRRRR